MSSLQPPLITAPPAPLAVHDRTHQIGALWRRVVAFIVDSLIVGLAGTLIALPLFGFFSRLGVWGRLVGLCMALPYFAILNSSAGSGQTVGKRWLGLRVVDKQGSTIPFSKSLLRYLLFAIPYFLNELPLPTSRVPWAFTSFLSIVIFALGGATFYLMLFNRRTRQGVHDLAAGSYVVGDAEFGPLQVQPIWRAHWIILSVLIPVLAIAIAVSGAKLERYGPFPRLLEDVRVVESLPNVQTAGVQELTWRNFNSNSTQHIFLVNVRWVGPSEGYDATADQIAKLILQHDPEVQTRDALRIVFIRGYDLGIAHGQSERTFEHTPSQWNDRVSGSSPDQPNAGTKL